MSLSLEQVVFVHPNGTRAVNGVNLNIGAGERVAVIGPSGAGKTTLLRLFATALRPTSGALNVLGGDPWRLDRGDLRRTRSRIGMVHQAPTNPAAPARSDRGACGPSRSVACSGRGSRRSYIRSTSPARTRCSRACRSPTSCSSVATGFLADNCSAWALRVCYINAPT